MAKNGAGGASSTLRILGLTSGLGCSVAVILVVLIGGGVFLDRRFDSAPLWTLIGLTIAVVSLVVEMATIVRISRSRSASAAWPKSSRPPDSEDDEDDDWR